MAYYGASEISSKLHQVAGVDDKPSSLHSFFKATLNLTTLIKESCLFVAALTSLG
jgi:hypothetical protein